MGISGYDNVLAAGPRPGGRAASGEAVLSLGARDLACSRNEKLLFHGLHFDVQAGQLLMIEGENGSGKTSLLKALCGFILPDEGEVIWGGNDIRDNMDEYLAAIHYVGHTNGIKHGLTCTENLKVAAALAAHDGSADIPTVLQQYGLAEQADVPAQVLSSGQRRRLALARFALSHAAIWIMDEPFTSLDAQGKTFVKEQMLRHLSGGGIIVLTSHEPVRLESASTVTLRL